MQTVRDVVRESFLLDGYVTSAEHGPEFLFSGEVIIDDHAYFFRPRFRLGKLELRGLQQMRKLIIGVRQRVADKEPPVRLR